MTAARTARPRRRAGRHSAGVRASRAGETAGPRIKSRSLAPAAPHSADISHPLHVPPHSRPEVLARHRKITASLNVTATLTIGPQSPHFPPHFRARRSLDDRRRWVSMRGLTRPDARRCHPAKARRYQPRRNSRLGVRVPSPAPSESHIERARRTPIRQEFHGNFTHRSGRP